MESTLQTLLDAILTWSDRTDPIMDMLGLLMVTFYALVGIVGLHAGARTWCFFLRVGGCFRFAAIFPVALAAYFMYHSDRLRDFVIAIALLTPSLVIRVAPCLYKVASHCFGLEYPPPNGIKVFVTTVVVGLFVMFVRALHRCYVPRGRWD